MDLSFGSEYDGFREEVKTFLKNKKTTRSYNSLTRQNQNSAADFKNGSRFQKKQIRKLLVWV